MNRIKLFYFVILHIFAGIGLLFIAVFFAIRLNLTNVSGSVDPINSDFQLQAQQGEILGTESTLELSASGSSDLHKIQEAMNRLSEVKEQKISNLCYLNELSFIAPKNVKKILNLPRDSVYEQISSKMIFAIATHLQNEEEFEKNVASCIDSFNNNPINEADILSRTSLINSANIFNWPDTKEWSDVAAAIIKDKDQIELASRQAGIESRVIMANLAVEQLRLYFSQRELYKKYFEPLKILASSNKISLGVMAIKEDTAAAVEKHLKDSSSPYYLGPEYEKVLDYSGGNISSERYKRLTSNDHYYNYFYGALYLKQMLKQWNSAGYDIKDRPEIIGTLFNVGFSQSNPNPHPQVGGSSVTINNTKYSFGRLAYEIYYSGELTEYFAYSAN